MNKEQELKKQIEELKKTEKEFETSIEFDNTGKHIHKVEHNPKFEILKAELRGIQHQKAKERS